MGIEVSSCGTSCNSNFGALLHLLYLFSSSCLYCQLSMLASPCCLLHDVCSVEIMLLVWIPLGLLVKIRLTYLLSKRQNQNATTKILSSIFDKVEPRNSLEKNKRNTFALQLSKAPKIWPKNEVGQRARELHHVKVNSYHNTAFQHHKQIEWFTVHVTK